MPTSSVAVRSLTFAVLGLSATSAFGQGSNVTAFNPWQSSGPASGYAGSRDPESREVSLARAQVMRSYLIDKDVKSRIEAGAYAGDGGSGGNERVDILVLNS